MFLLGLIGDPGPAGEKDPKSDPKSSNLNNLEYASFPPSLTGDAFSINPNVCSLDDDLHGMNLSLHMEDFDFEGEDKFDIVRGDPKFDAARKEPEKVSRRSDVWDIPGGRLSPVFLAWGESIFWVLFDLFASLRDLGFAMDNGFPIKKASPPEAKRAFFLGLWFSL